MRHALRALALPAALLAAAGAEGPPSEPGEEHKRLAPFVGSWSATIKAWSSPDAPPAVFEGGAEFRWALGGRFVEQRFTASFAGKPFNGVGYLGYERPRKRFVSLWLDDASTEMMLRTGAMDGKSFTASGENYEPALAAFAAVKETTTVVDANTLLFELWKTPPGGKPRRELEIVYRRR